MDSCYPSCSPSGRVFTRTDLHIVDFDISKKMTTYLSFAVYWTKTTDKSNGDLRKLLMLSWAFAKTLTNIQSKNVDEVSFTIKKYKVAVRWKMCRIWKVNVV